ncbi:MAG: hypothetical protein R3302_09290, partial [Sulfurimonadaceae bacterium]|nr:hypothetical protein [Sulfurimonadaceae bacterium]
STTLDALAGEFQLDDDLRRRIKSQRIELLYRADLQLGDTLGETPEAEIEIEGEVIDTDAAGEHFVLEIGTTTLSIEGKQSSLIRMRLQ